jgi:hypothetical protein
MKSFRTLCASLALFPAACTTPGGGPLGLVLFDSNHNVSAAEPLFGKGDERCLDDPTFLLTIYAEEKQVDPDKSVDVCTRMRRAIQWALRTNAGGAQPSAQEQRNEVVDALMAASDRKCGRYTAYLQQYDGNVNSTFGILAQATSAIATLSTGGTAKALSAASTISEGTRGTLNTAWFANKTVGVLAQAYENRRDNDRKAIQKDLAEKTLAQYSLMRGMGDAFRYHADCSIVVGLQEAQQAVSNKVKRDENDPSPGAGAGNGNGDNGGDGGNPPANGSNNGNGGGSQPPADGKKPG